jgi:thymidylate synthase (FAD)
MKIVEPSVEFIVATPHIGQVIELGARNCYKSEDKMGEGTDEKLFNQIVKQHHHDSVVEHGSITVRLITDRAMLAQITRHRHFSFSVESQRYCNYTKDKFDGNVQFVKPYDITIGSAAWRIWKQACSISEGAYQTLLEEKCKPETARSVLNNSAKASIFMTGNVRSWREFFKLRMAGHAQKDIQHLTQLIYQSFMANDIPAYLFDDVVRGN